MTPDEKKRLVEGALKQEAGRRFLANADRLYEEIEEKFMAEGVPASLLQYMRARQHERLAMHDFARKLFPVQSLPDGALSIYERDLEVASMVADGPEAGS